MSLRHHQSILPQSDISLHCNDFFFYRNCTKKENDPWLLLCGRHLTNSHNGKFSHAPKYITYLSPDHLTIYSTNCPACGLVKAAPATDPKRLNPNIDAGADRTFPKYNPESNAQQRKKNFRIKTHNLNRFVGHKKKTVF